MEEKITIWSYLGLAFMVVADIAMVCSLIWIFG